MDYLLKNRSGDFLRAQLLLKDGKKVFFTYREESPKSYQKYNSFIQGMDWIKATASISTATKLALAYGDNITLNNGATLKVVSIQPVTDARRAMYAKETTVRYLINLE